MARQKTGGAAGGKVALSRGRFGRAAKTAKLPRAERRAAGKARRQQIRDVVRTVRQHDLPGLLISIALVLVPLVAGIVAGIFTGHYIYLPVIGLLIGVIAGLAFFGRRAQAAVFSEIEGQPGYAAGVIGRMKKWILTPAVGVTRTQDILHRAVGRAGVVLVAEGPSPAAQKNLAAEEARRIRRFAAGTEITTVFVGAGNGQVPLRKLQAHLMKLPKVMQQGDAVALDRRLKALDKGPLPIPKGPMPTRVPRGKVR